MKKRTGFVSNSSSSSFVMLVTNNSEVSYNMDTYIHDNLFHIYTEVLGLEGLIEAIGENCTEAEYATFDPEDIEGLKTLLAGHVKNLRLHNNDIAMTLDPGDRVMLCTISGDGFRYDDPSFEYVKVVVEDTTGVDIFSTSFSS